MEQKTCGKIIAIKVFTILTYIGIGLSALSFIAILANPGFFAEIAPEIQNLTTTYAIVGLIFVAVSLFIGIFATKKIKTTQNKSQLIAISIIALLFFNLIVGILMLCLNDDDLKKYQGR